MTNRRFSARTDDRRQSIHRQPGSPPGRESGRRRWANRNTGCAAYTTRVRGPHQGRTCAAEDETVGAQARPVFLEILIPSSRGCHLPRFRRTRWAWLVSVFATETSPQSHRSRSPQGRVNPDARRTAIGKDIFRLTQYEADEIIRALNLMPEHVAFLVGSEGWFSAPKRARASP
jgi:hypothetical protein